MALEGLLTKLGPTLVREVTPHLMQMVAGFGERFRKDTGEIKAAVDTELASVARTHEALTAAVDGQRDRLEALQTSIAAVDRKVDLLHGSLQTLSRQLASDTATATNAQRATRNLALLAVVFSALAFGSALVTFFLHR